MKYRITQSVHLVLRDTFLMGLLLLGLLLEDLWLTAIQAMPSHGLGTLAIDVAMSHSLMTTKLSSMSSRAITAFNFSSASLQSPSRISTR